MNKLVLGALLAVASLATGCSSNNGDDVVVVGTTVTVNWDFIHFADNTVRACPTNFGTATIVSQTIDDRTHLGTGTKFVDKFDCKDGAGTLVLPDGDTYLIWVQIENDAGTTLYAQSEEVFVDTARNVAPVDVVIYDDAGFFFFEWDLVDSVTNAPLSCSQAGVAGANGAVESSATIVGNASILFTDKFTCDDHYGTTDPLLAGNYTVSVEATVNDLSVGNAPAISKSIKAPNGLTDLGLVVIPID
jgi:hypothetical protein